MRQSRLTNSSPFPGLSTSILSAPQAPQSRANQVVGYYKVEGTARAKAQKWGLSGEITTKSIMREMLSDTGAGDRAAGAACSKNSLEWGPRDSS